MILYPNNYALYESGVDLRDELRQIIAVEHLLDDCLELDQYGEIREKLNQLYDELDLVEQTLGV